VPEFRQLAQPDEAPLRIEERDSRFDRLAAMPTDGKFNGKLTVGSSL
jgi:hypothetical protein